MNCIELAKLLITQNEGFEGKGYYIWGIQFEDVTGQSIQTPAEYVSTNVLSSPYHGANVDWVKYFDTEDKLDKILKHYEDSEESYWEEVANKSC